MERDIKAFRVFGASPSDVPDERSAIRDVVQRINGIYARTSNLRLELLAWEDTAPGVGRPQSLINPYVDKADLFVGCLWKTLGSPSSKDGKLTGFEEEFYRARDRHSKDGEPEIWLFFKDIDAKDSADPNVQKVLAFRAEQEKTKELKFQRFNATEEWSKLILDLLHEHMLRTIRRLAISEKEVTATGQPQTQPSESQETTPGPESKATSAVTTLGDLFAEATKKIRGGKLSDLNRSAPLSPAQSARFMLFATAYYDWNVQRVVLGNHEINSVYWHRSELDPTVLERLLLLRTIVLDGTLHKPGWFWASNSKLRIDVWLPWLALHDSDEATRETAVELATQIGFSLCRPRKKDGSLVERILADQSKAVRVSALKHLAAFGGVANLPACERLQHDDDKDVRIESERTLQIIRMSSNPDEAARRYIEKHDSPDEEITAKISKHADKLSVATLTLALNHPHGAVRVLAAREFLRRGNVPADLTKKMVADGAKGVRECGYFARVRAGEILEPSDIRAGLIGTFSISLSLSEPDWNRGDPDAIVAECFNRLSEEELWKRVDAFNEDSHIALTTLGNRFYQETARIVRDELRNDFQEWKSTLTNRPSLASSPSFLSGLYSVRSDATEEARKRLCVSALKILSQKPVQSDRELFLKFLSVDWGQIDQTIASLNGLLAVGRPDDRTKLEPLLSSEAPQPMQAVTARVYLSLSPNAVVAAKDLLSQALENRVWAVISFALSSQNNAFAPAIQSLLQNENEDIRRLACFYLVKTQSRTLLRKMLERYLAEGPYFYNVVTLFDRALYAPTKLRTHYLEEEKLFFEKWRPTPRWNLADFVKL